MAEIEFRKTVILKASPEKVWEALVSPEIVKQYHLAPLRLILLKRDGEINYGTETETMISGRIIEVERPKKLVHTFAFASQRQAGVQGDPVTVVAYDLSGNDSETTLTLVHSGFGEENQTYANISGGWPFILESLKRVLEQ